MSFLDGCRIEAGLPPFLSFDSDLTNFMRHLLFLSAFLLESFILSAQEPLYRTRQVFLETGTYQSFSGPTPFWLRTNQYGTVPLTPSNGTVRAGLRADYRSTRSQHKPIDVAYGVEAVLNAPGASWQVVLPEAYAKVRFWPVELQVGRRREVFGLVDTLLTSGSYIWSGNALPMPKLQLSIPEYWPARSFIGIKGNFAHGFFEANRPFSHGVRLHQKSFYVRLGKADWPVKFHGGFNHQVQWGGTSPFYSNNGQLPSNLEAYWYVVTARSVEGDSLKFGNTFDGGNRVGNHLGSIDLALEITLAGSSFLLYRQSVYEDGSLFRLSSIADGLNGIRWQNNSRATLGFRIQRLTLEYLYTMSQGGDVFSYDPNHRGRDDYFNHNQFREGWSYGGRGIGTPFITANGDLRDGIFQSGGFTSNNRVRVAHLGVLASASPTVRLEGKVSYSWNAGTYDVPFRPERTQLSAYLRCSATLGFLDNTEFSGAVGYDRGELLTDALGVNLRLRKTWSSRRYQLVKADGPKPEATVPTTLVGRQ